MVCVLTERDLRSLHHLIHRLRSQGLIAESEALRNILRAGSERDEVRAAVAAQILHVSPQTIRNWVKRRTLSGRIDETGHVYVAADALKPAIEMDAAIPYRSPSDPEITMDDILGEIDAHRAEQPSSEITTD